MFKIQKAAQARTIAEQSGALALQFIDMGGKINDAMARADEMHKMNLAGLDDAIANQMNQAWADNRTKRLKTLMDDQFPTYAERFNQLKVWALALKDARKELINPAKMLSVAGFANPEKANLYLNMVSKTTGRAALHDLRERAIAENNLELAWALQTHLSSLPVKDRPFLVDEDLAAPLFAKDIEKINNSLACIEAAYVAACKMDTLVTGTSHSQDLLAFGLKRDREAYARGENPNSPPAETDEQRQARERENETEAQAEQRQRRERLAKLGLKLHEAPSEGEPSVNKISRGLASVLPAQ